MTKTPVHLLFFFVDKCPIFGKINIQFLESNYWVTNTLSTQGVLPVVVCFPHYPLLAGAPVKLAASFG